MLPDWLEEEVIIKKKVIAIFVMTLGIIILGIIGYNINAGADKGIVIEADAQRKVSDLQNDKSAASENDKKSEEIQIYVVGCVKSPGIVTLKKGQIVKDAIVAAGGATNEADIYNINLAYELNQNAMLKIKSKNQNTENTGNQQVNSGIEMKTGEESVVANGGEQKGQGQSKVNINSASAEELDALPGIGASTAAKIINFRESNGSFKAIEEIMNVPGIGQSKFDALKDMITTH